MAADGSGTATTVLISGGRLHDGTGEPSRLADVLVRDGHVQTIAPTGMINIAGVPTIAAEGRIVCPPVAQALGLELLPPEIVLGL